MYYKLKCEGGPLEGMHETRLITSSNVNQLSDVEQIAMLAWKNSGGQPGSVFDFDTPERKHRYLIIKVSQNSSKKELVARYVPVDDENE